MALLYNLAAAASAKSKTEVDCPGPSEKVDITEEALPEGLDELGSLIGALMGAQFDLVGQFCWVSEFEGQFH